MKYVGLLISSVVVFLVILTNFYYNSITLDMQKIKDYIVESNIILEDIVKKEEQVMEKKDEYITRLINLKGIKNSKTSFLVKDYKEYKIKSIEGLIKSISESDLKYLEEVEKYNNLSEKELDKILNKSLIEVTYLPINTYT